MDTLETIKFKREDYIQQYKHAVGVRDEAARAVVALEGAIAATDELIKMLTPPVQEDQPIPEVSPNGQPSKVA